MRKKFEAKFKARVALEALKGEKTLSQISSEYEVHTNMVSRWKQELLKGMPEIFSRKNGKQPPGLEAENDKLYKAVGKLKVENDWIKKKLDLF